MKKYNTNKRYFEDKLINNPVEKLPIDIKIPNTVILGMYSDDAYLGLHVMSITSKGICKHCGCIISRFKGYSTSTLIYASINHRLLLVKIDNKKYKCLDCNKVTTEQILNKAGLKRMTTDVLDGIIVEISKEESNTFSSVSRNYKLTRSRIRQIFDEIVQLDEVNYDNIKSICIDENKIMQSKKLGYSYQLILLDAVTKKIVHIEIDRKKDNVKNALSLFPNLKTISTDLWNPYKDTIIDMFGNKVDIIPDNFHVVRLFSWAFSRTRRYIYEGYGQSKSKHWRILTKRKDNLKEYAKEILNRLLKKYTLLNPVYEAKEMAYNLFTKNSNLTVEESIAKFRKELNEFKCFVHDNNLKEFEKPLDTLDEWSEHIENIFIYPNLSNGILERLNSSIKYIKRASRGFKNPEMMKKIIISKINKKKYS